MSNRDRGSDYTKSDVEDLYGEIRRLRRLVKISKREIERLRKYEARSQNAKFHQQDQADKKLEAQASKPKPPKKPTCRHCQSDNTDTMDFGIRVYLICHNCSQRSRMD